MGIGMDSPALHIKKDLLKKVAQANAQTSASLPGRPIMNAIGFWEDEPAGVVMGKLPSRAVYEDLVSAIDVSAPYLYPVPDQPLSSVGDAVARARSPPAARSLSCRSCSSLPGNRQTVIQRRPNCAMAFLAPVEGATNRLLLLRLGHRPAQTVIAAAQPELWKSVKKLNQDLSDIAPRLLWRQIE